MTIGLDLGTTWTAAAVSDGNGCRVAPLEDDSVALASVIAFKDGATFFGRQASNVLRSDPAAGACEFKRRLGDSTPLILDGTPYGAEALMGRMVEEVIDRVNRAGHGPIANVALAHPANWGEYKLELLRDAARLAGHESVELVAEPVAAALHYAGAGMLDVGDANVVFDFGGGTLDIAVVEMGEDRVDLLGPPQGLERLGGVDVDQVVLGLVNVAVGGVLSEVDTDDPDVRAAIFELRLECTRAKEALSTQPDYSVPVRLPSLNTDVRITRSELEAAFEPRVPDILNSVDRALSSARTASNDLGVVVLVGGASLAPMIGESISSHLGVQIVAEDDRTHAVALGSAMYGQKSGETTLAAGANVGGVLSIDADTEVTRPAGPADTSSRSRLAWQETTRSRMGTAARAAAAAGVVGVAAAGSFAAWRRTTGGGEAVRDEVDATDESTAAPDVVRVDVPVDVLEDVPTPSDPPIDPVDYEWSPATAVSQPREQTATEQPPMYLEEKPSSAEGAFTETPQGRIAQAVFAMASPAAVTAQESNVNVNPVSESVVSAPASSIDTSQDLEFLRSQLHGRLASFEVPEGADPEHTARLESDLANLVDRFQPYPGQPIEDAIATLRYEFEDRVRDFAQDQQIQAVVDEQLRQIREAEELEAAVEGFKEQLGDRLTDWSPPVDVDPDQAAELKADLVRFLDRYRAVPGQSPEDAIAEIRDQFDERIEDLSQEIRIEALIDEAFDAGVDEESLDPEVGDAGVVGSVDGTAVEAVDSGTGVAAGAATGDVSATESGQQSVTGSPEETRPAQDQRPTEVSGELIDVFDEITADSPATSTTGEEFEGLEVDDDHVETGGEIIEQIDGGNAGEYDDELSDTGNDFSAETPSGDVLGLDATLEPSDGEAFVGESVAGADVTDTEPTDEVIVSGVRVAEDSFSDSLEEDVDAVPVEDVPVLVDDTNESSDPTEGAVDLEVEPSEGESLDAFDAIDEEDDAYDE